MATSGAVVTMSGRTCGSRESPTTSGPNASCVEIGLLVPTPVESGTFVTSGGAAGGSAGHSARTAAHCPAEVIGSSRFHSVSRVSPTESRNSSTWLEERRS